MDDFFRILLPSQNIWTLMVFLFVKNGLVIAQKKTFNQKCMQKIPKPDSHYCLLVCQVRYRTPSHELSNKKRRKRILCFFRRQHLLTLILQSDKWSVLIAVLLCSKTSTYLVFFRTIKRKCFSPFFLQKNDRINIFLDSKAIKFGLLMSFLSLIS